MSAGLTLLRAAVHGRAAITGVTSALEATLLPFGLATSDTAFQNSPSSYIESDGRLGLFMINRMPTQNAASTTPLATSAS